MIGCKLNQHGLVVILTEILVRHINIYQTFFLNQSVFYLECKAADAMIFMIFYNYGAARTVARSFEITCSRFVMPSVEALA